MKMQRRTLSLLVVIVVLLGLFFYVALRSGPLAAVAVTSTKVELRSIAPALFGIGTVQARYTYKIGPTYTGRLKQLNAEVGDFVTAGQVLGEIDAVDLDEKINAQQAGIRRAEAVNRQAEAVQAFAQSQVKRYESLLASRNASEESVAVKRQELAIAKAAQQASYEDVLRLGAELKALRLQRVNLQLIAPVAGLVVARNTDLGTTVLAGQAVVEIIDPNSLWVHTRFDQASATGLAANLPVHIILRSQQANALSGKVLRVEPLADAVTEEMLAKITFDALVSPLPPLGELAEVTVQLEKLPAAVVIPNAVIRTIKGQRGVWKLVNNKPVFTPILLGRADLDGNVQVTKGLAVGDELVLYSARAITANSRLQITESLKGAAR